MIEKLRDIKIIDVKKSVVDSDKTKEREMFVFKKKAYYKFRDNAGLSPWWFYWVPKDDDSQINWLQNTQNYEFVGKDDLYVPDGIKLNAENHYQYGDLVLMKCPLQEYIMRRMKAREKADARVKSRKNQFNEDVMKDGGQSLSEDELQNLLGEA